FTNHYLDIQIDKILEWAIQTKNELVQIICQYNQLSLPARGNSVLFQPLEHLPATEYRRPPVSALGLSDDYLDPGLCSQSDDTSQFRIKLANAEEAHSLSRWSTATICRTLSLETILSLLTGVLLEKQVAVVCPNLGVLSAVVLSTIPMIRPFEWQSLFLPILPEMMLDFVDAPVPFIV
ncbi:hypothetical protein M569_16689, partial [Genlisea aurea]